MSYSNRIINFLSSTLNEGLLNYYKFDGNSNDSINANNGTDSHVTYITSRIKQGLDFTTNNTGYVSISNIALTTNFSISFWFEISTTTSVYQALVSRYSANEGIYFQNTINKLICYDGIGGYNYNDTTLSVGQLYHAVLTVENNQGQWYLNGINDSSPFVVNDIILNRFGYTHPTYTAFEGTIDEFGFWDKTLTQDEVTELYNCGYGKSTPF